MSLYDKRYLDRTAPADSGTFYYACYYDSYNIHNLANFLGYHDTNAQIRIEADRSGIRTYLVTDCGMQIALAHGEWVTIAGRVNEPPGAICVVDEDIFEKDFYAKPDPTAEDLMHALSVAVVQFEQQHGVTVKLHLCDPSGPDDAPRLIADIVYNE